MIPLKKEQKKALSSMRKPSSGSGEVRLNVPWMIDGQHRLFGHNIIQAVDGKDSVAAKFIEERSKVHDTYIREYYRTKRLGVVISSIMLAASYFVVMFAPAGREIASYFIGAFLLLSAAGTAGLTAITLKGPGFSMEARDKWQQRK